MVRSLFFIVTALAAGIAFSCARGTPEAGAVKPDPSHVPIATAEDAAPSPLLSPSAVIEPPAVATPAKPLSTAQCNKLWDHAQKADADAYASADKKCATAADCEAVHVRACLADCASGGIAKSASAAYAKVRATIDATDCKAWFDGSCVTKTPTPVPSCPMYVAICSGGICGTKIGP
jgi:hypothetical protein